MCDVIYSVFFISVCNPGPCQNGGTCNERDGKFLGCTCPPGFKPPYCTSDKPGNS